MSTVDPRTPVIVGAAQINDREYGCEPLDLMVRCTVAALDDTGAKAGFTANLDVVRVVWGIWPYADPGRLVADLIGAPHARSALTTSGGNQVYDLVIDTADRIRRGELDTAVLCAAESLRTRRSDRRRGTTTEYLPEHDGAAPDELIGKDQPMFNAVEEEIGISPAVARFYAMAETANRHRLGEGIDEHRRRIALMWADASEIASRNPQAWSRDAVDAATIATPSESNRPVASPYPKMMTSNLNVDQGGAVVMCSAAAAEAAGVPRERWVFPWAGVGAADAWHATNRWAFDASPAMRISGNRTLELAGVRHDDCELIDVYSCFPVAVQVAQRELSLDPTRDWTFTGGLTFAAGPLNCYSILGLTRAVTLLRESPDHRAFVTGNGGVFTKHSSLVLSGAPHDDGFLTDDVQAEVDALPQRPDPAGHVADACTLETYTLETYTVTFDREMRPERAILSCLDEAGSRHWAESADPDTMTELLTADCCERPVHLDKRTAHLT